MVKNLCAKKMILSQFIFLLKKEDYGGKAEIYFKEK